MSFLQTWFKRARPVPATAGAAGIAGDAAIEARDLTKVFGKFTAVDRVSFRVERGDIFGFLGPNGAGKSTTIRMLCGLLASTSGQARVNGFDINEHPERVRQSIGYMSQKFSLYKELTAGENLAFFGGVYGLTGARLRERASEVAARAGLAGLEDRITGHLSGAVQQRLALACAILHEPSILFLDEPTSGVDPMSRRRFWDLIHDLAAQGVTILITTHFLDEAEFCRRIAFINAGRLVALSTPAAIKHEAVHEDLFEAALDSPRGAREAASKIPGVAAVSFFGPRLRLFCTPGAWTAEPLAAALRAAGLPVRSVERAAVRLEDVFVRLAETTGGRAP